MKTPTLLLLFAFCLWSFVPATLEARDRDTVDYYFKEAEKVLNQGDRSQALRLFETALSYVNNKNGKKNEYQYTELLDYLAVLKCEVGEVDQAIAYEDEVILWRREHKSDFGVIGDAVSKKAVFYSYKKDYDAAIKYAEEAADLLRRRFGEKDHVYSVNLMNLASYYSLRGAGAQDYQKAVEVGERAIKHIDNYTSEYAYALNSLVIYYAQAEMNDKANSLTPKAIQKGRSIFGRQSRAFADVLAQQAVRLANLHNYSQAIDYCVEARNIYAADSVVNVLPYARILGSLGSFCKQAERFDQGIEALTEACAVYEHLKYENTQEYVNCVSNLTALYRLKGDLEKADALAIQSAQALNSATATDNYVAYGKSLSEQGWMYAANGDFRHAIETEQRALDVFTENADTLNMARSMNDLSSHCFNAGQHDKALALCQQAIDLVRKYHLHTTVLGRAYNNLSLYHYRLGDNRRALELSRAAVRNYEEEGDVRGSHYAKILGNLAMFYYLNDSIDMAVNIARRSLDLQASTLGEEHPDLVVTYHNLANYYLAKNDKEQMRYYFERALEMQSRLVRNNFSHLSTSGRELYWNTKNYIFKVAPSIAARSDGDDVLVGDAYNAQLFTKGILLNSEIDFKNFLFKTGETELLSKYEELERLHKRIDDFRHSAVNDHAEVERLQSQANRLERELIRGCKEFGDFTSNLSITYEQVAHATMPPCASVMAGNTLALSRSSHRTNLSIRTMLAATSSRPCACLRPSMPSMSIRRWAISSGIPSWRLWGPTPTPSISHPRECSTNSASSTSSTTASSASTSATRCTASPRPSRLPSRASSSPSRRRLSSAVSSTTWTTKNWHAVTPTIPSLRSTCWPRTTPTTHALSSRPTPPPSTRSHEPECALLPLCQARWSRPGTSPLPCASKASTPASSPRARAPKRPSSRSAASTSPLSTLPPTASISPTVTRRKTPS